MTEVAYNIVKKIISGDGGAFPNTESNFLMSWCTSGNYLYPHQEMRGHIRKLLKGTHTRQEMACLTTTNIITW
jgi:hypothetical protein